MSFGFGKPPAPPKSSSETFLSAKPTNQELGGYFTALAGALTYVAKYLDDDLRDKITESLKPLATDVAAIKTDTAVIKNVVLPKMGTDISSIKTTLAMTSDNVVALDVLLFLGLVSALYLKNEENKKMSEELDSFYKKRR